MSTAIFEPRFYERCAQRHLVALANAPVWINVPWALTGNPASRPEIDAIWVRAGRAVAAEAKAYQVDEPTAREVEDKYRSLGFENLLIIAPYFTAGALEALACSRRPTIEPLAFSPNLTEVAGFYREPAWQDTVPAWVHDSLATGLHHLRFILTEPDSSGRFVVGQQRTRIYDTDSVTKAIAKLPSPPARVLWTPQRFTIPRDVIARRSKLTALGGYIAVDIDGDRLHRADHACQLAPGTAGCQHCLDRARREFIRLSAVVGDVEWTALLFSGGRGIHAYLPDHNLIRSQLVTIASSNKIRIDSAVTASVKSTISLPGSLHAANGQQVTPLSEPELSRRVAAAC